MTPDARYRRRLFGALRVRERALWRAAHRLAEHGAYHDAATLRRDASAAATVVRRMSRAA